MKTPEEVADDIVDTIEWRAGVVRMRDDVLADLLAHEIRKDREAVAAEIEDRSVEEIATAAIRADAEDHWNMEIANVEDVHAIVVRAIKMDRERATAQTEVQETGDYRDGTEAEDTGGY